MGFLDTLKRLFQADPDRHHKTVYARCARCGEILKTRLNLYNDLSVEYGGRRGQDSYYARKVLLGDSGCFNRVELEMTFDSQRRLVEVEAQGGEYLTPEEAVEVQGEQ
jgi:hypothetical protein